MSVHYLASLVALRVFESFLALHHIFNKCILTDVGTMTMILSLQETGCLFPPCWTSNHVFRMECMGGAAYMHLDVY